MSRSKPYTFNLVKWKTLLDDKVMIPMNQRQYSWREDNVTQFCNDITSFFEEEKFTILMGQIVHCKIDGMTITSEVYDGQSRTLTIWMIVMAIAHQYDELKRSIYNRLFIDINVDSELPIEYKRIEAQGICNIPKIRCINDYDNEALIYIANLYEKNNIDWSKEKSTNTCIVENYEFIHQYVKDMKYSFKRMRDFYNFIIEGIDVNLCMCTDLDYVAYIFEWSNNRGKKVEDLDVVKNRILAKISDMPRKFEVYNKWVDLRGRPYGPKIFDCAIQIYNRKLVRHNNTSVALYKDLVSKDDVSSEIDVFFNIVEKLYSIHERIQTDKYGRYLNDCITWEGFSLQLLPCMVTLGFSQSLLRLNSDWGVRNLPLSPKAKTYNNLAYSNKFIDVTNAVLSGAITTMTEYEKAIAAILKENLDDRVRVRDDFINMVSNIQFKQVNSKKATRLLEYLETSYHTNTSFPPSDVTLEHILPRKSEHSQETINQLGNMTLLEGCNSENGHRGNKSIKAKKYDDKKPSYIHSSFRLSNKLAEQYPSFEEADVQHRTRILAEALETLTRFY